MVNLKTLDIDNWSTKYKIREIGCKFISAMELNNIKYISLCKTI